MYVVLLFLCCTKEISPDPQIQTGVNGSSDCFADGLTHSQAVLLGPDAPLRLAITREVLKLSSPSRPPHDLLSP